MEITSTNGESSPISLLAKTLLSFTTWQTKISYLLVATPSFSMEAQHVAMSDIWFFGNYGYSSSAQEIFPLTAKAEMTAVLSSSHFRVVWYNQFASHRWILLAPSYTASQITDGFSLLHCIHHGWDFLFVSILCLLCGLWHNSAAPCLPHHIPLALEVDFS
jgi:hypothetical protein